MAPLPWQQFTERMVGRGHPTLADTNNRALRALLSGSGYDPDAATFPGLMGPVFNVKAFGAKGDNGTDDTAAIQAALTMAGILGGTVVIPVGVYLITAVLTHDTNVSIVGMGGASIIRNAVTRNKDTAWMLQPIANGRTNAVFRDFVLDQRSDVLGQSPSSFCHSVHALTGCLVENVVYRNIITMAVWADTPVAQGVTKAIRIDTIRVEGSEGGGISVFGNISQWSVANSHFENTKDDAIAFQQRNDGAQPSDCTINGNVVLNADRRNVALSTPRGILLQGCTRFAVGDNVVNKTVSDAYCLIPNVDPCSKIALSNNVAYQAGVTVDSIAGVPGNGFRVQDGIDITIDAGCAAYGSRENGMRVHGSPDRIKVNDNTCVGNGYSGIELQNVRDFTLNGNTLCDNGAVASPQPFGIFLSSTTRDLKTGTISNNRIGQSALGVAGFTQTEGIRIGTAAGFVATDVTIGHNNVIGNTVAAFGGVAGVNIVKSRNRYTTGAQQGRTALVNGTVTVNTVEVLAADSISLTRVVVAGTTRGILTVGTIVAGTSFVIRAEDLAGALSADDDSTVFWEIVH